MAKLAVGTKVQTNFRLPEGLVHKLKVRAAETGFSQAEIVAQALRIYLKTSVADGAGPPPASLDADAGAREPEEGVPSPPPSQPQGRDTAEKIVSAHAEREQAIHAHMAASTKNTSAQSKRADAVKAVDAAQARGLPVRVGV
jgi:plasmid stability protein